jgi:hypothetical protein
MPYRLKTDLDEPIGPRFDTQEESYAYACGVCDGAVDEHEAAVINAWTLWHAAVGSSDLRLVATDFADNRRRWVQQHP